MYKTTFQMIREDVAENHAYFRSNYGNLYHFATMSIGLDHFQGNVPLQIAVTIQHNTEQPAEPQEAMEPVVHYALAVTPLCNSSPEEQLTVTTDPTMVTGCHDCFLLAFEDMFDTAPQASRCLHCHTKITANGSTQWRRAVRKPCPACGRPDW